MAQNFENGISAYIHAQAVVDVYFPVDLKGNADISCRQCKFFRWSSHSCALNNEVTQYPERYIGGSCPLELKEE